MDLFLLHRPRHRGHERYLSCQHRGWDAYASERRSLRCRVFLRTVAGRQHARHYGKGTVAGQWWRKGHSHLDESEVWLVRDLSSATPKYERFAGGENVAGGEKVLWPMWAGDGRGIYYVSDRGGAENIWFRAAGGGSSQSKQVTHF